MAFDSRLRELYPWTVQLERTRLRKNDKGTYAKIDRQESSHIVSNVDENGVTLSHDLCRFLLRSPSRYKASSNVWKENGVIPTCFRRRLKVPEEVLGVRGTEVCIDIGTALVVLNSQSPLLII